MTTVWVLRHDTAHFNTLSLRDSRYGTFPRLDGTSQFETWEPPQVWYDPIKFREGKALADFPAWSVHTVGDTKAKVIMEESIAEHVEFLPLVFLKWTDSEHLTTTSYDDEYFVFNVLTTLDCLDIDRSEFAYFESTGAIRNIRKCVFKPEYIRDTPIFKLPILNRVTTYVTDSFKQLVDDNNLTGLEFRKVWEG